MSLRLQCTTGTLLLLAGAAFMVYAYMILCNAPYMCAAVMLWLSLVEYSVGRAWWVDLQEVLACRRRQADEL